LFKYLRLTTGSSLASSLSYSFLGTGALIAVATVPGGWGLSIGFGSISAVFVGLNIGLFCYERRSRAGAFVAR
jgi:hypothetical protein